VTGKNTEAEQNDTINIVGHIFFDKYDVDYTKQARKRVYAYEIREKENGNRI